MGKEKRKVTVRASSDIALVKYWGKKDEGLRLPENGSISMVLDGLFTTTTVEFLDRYKMDEVTISGEQNDGEVARVVEHLNRIRELSAITFAAKVVSENSFPKSTGLSSSGSGFAALTLAASKAVGLHLSQKELSILARQASGTACRCVCGGFVEWRDGNTSSTSFSQTLYPADYWDLRDVVVVVDEGKKRVSSTEGHTTAQTSVFYPARQKHIKKKINMVKEAIQKRDFSQLGELVEAEALEFHAILLTSRPSYIAWYSGTVEVMHVVQALRREGIEVYFTINTGFNVHVLTLPKYEQVVKRKLKGLSGVKKVILTKVGRGPEETKEHLF